MAWRLIPCLLGSLLCAGLPTQSVASPGAPLPAAASPAPAGLTQWRDDAGTAWQLPARLPQRWVVLGPHLVDMLHAIGARERIVGVQDDHLLPGAHARSLTGHPVVGFADRVHDERLWQQKPDLIVYWPSGISPQPLAHLRRLGLPMLAVEPARLEDIPQRLRWLGALAGRAQAADALARQHERRLLALRSQRSDGPRLRGFYQIWQAPLYTLSPDHLTSQALRLCGVDSIVSDRRMASPVVQPESVLRARPDIILVAPEQLAEARRYWRRFPSLPAVQRQAIVSVDDRALTRPGLSLLDALPSLCAQMKPWRAGAR